jgi:trk system potassium uptake protein
MLFLHFPIIFATVMLKLNFSELKIKFFKLGTKFDFPGKLVNSILFIIIAILFIFAIQDIGFSFQNNVKSHINNPYYHVLFLLTGILYLIRSIFLTDHIESRKAFLANFILGIILMISFSSKFLLGYGFVIDRIFYEFYGYQLLSIILFILELSRLKIELLTRLLNPAQLFIVSFGLIIFFGAMLLMMPLSTTTPISFVDSLFTATSAVCVTGLTAVDTATRFTFLGKFIILGLIQIGGIGVMTITSFFGFFFKETSSFREQMLLRDYMSEDSLTGILKALIKVVLFTILIEAVGAAFIYFSLRTEGLGSNIANLKFSIFHAVSAFCNAGFSTLTDNLYDIRIRNNYSLHYSVANLIVLGGLGFPVLLNLYKYMKAQAIWLWGFIKYRRPYIHRVGMITFNSKIVITATFVLLVFGTLSFLFLESDFTQKGLDFHGKLAMSYFQSVTPRTAGFNNCNMEALAKPSMLIMIFLMWVGASPVSTGGGVKTSTFAIAILNMVRIIRGKNHIEIHRHEIHEYSVNKAFAIIILSIFIICMGIFGIYLIDGKYGLLRIVFECFSAFGTVGLSINLTPLLSSASKVILISLMFMGRMGCITLLLSLSRSLVQQSLYRYPKENIIIT